MYNPYESSEDRSKKIEKEFNEFMIQFDAAKREFENFLIDNQIDLDELKERLSNKDNFSDREWEFIEEKRREFKAMNELLNQQYAAPQKAKSKEIRPGWIFCR